MFPRLVLLASLVAFPAAAQHQHHRPYAGLPSREAAALSPEQMADLRAGRGMSLALPAELNGYPGPMHALELAEPLGLSAAQRATLSALMSDMRREAIPLGEQVIAAERRLDAIFISGTASAAAIEAATEAAALAHARLRAAHLRTHLATREALSEAQRAAYDRERGYARR